MNLIAKTKLSLTFFITLLMSVNLIGQKTIDKAQVKEVVMIWNQAHNPKNNFDFYKLYADTILLYGNKQTKEACITKKLNFLKKYPAYFQEIVSEIDVEYFDDNMKCSFVKKVQLDKTPKNYPSYLIFKKIKNNWLIVAESDLITDKNLVKKQSEIPKDATLGDYKGDGKKEFMWLKKPKLTNDMDCVGACVTYIVFSDATIPQIKVETCIGGYPTNRGDLNQNGTDEIGLNPEWFTSCWRVYYVWTFVKNKWTYAVEPYSTHCYQWRKGTEVIKIDKKRPGNVIIEFSEWKNDDIVVSKKSLKIVK